MVNRTGEVMAVGTTISIKVENKVIAWRIVPGDKLPEVLARLIAALGDQEAS